VPLTRWEPFVSNPWNRLHNEMERLFDRLSDGFQAGPARAVSFPAVNLWEEANNVFVEAELPGMKLDNLEIYVNEGNQLSIQGNRQPEQIGEGVWHRQERGFGQFSRVIPLPAAVNPDKVQAKFEQGVLFITLPKAEHAKPRRITVKGE
jgi:HSP20 family protein